MLWCDVQYLQVFSCKWLLPWRVRERSGFPHPHHQIHSCHHRNDMKHLQSILQDAKHHHNLLSFLPHYLLLFLHRFHSPLRDTHRFQEIRCLNPQKSATSLYKESVYTAKWAYLSDLRVFLKPPLGIPLSLKCKECTGRGEVSCISGINVGYW